MPPRPVARSLALALVTIAAGLAVRFVPLGLPFFWVKYGGSMLWALMIYWIVSTLLGSARPAVGAIVSGLMATEVECIKLYRAPWLDAFRLTLPGVVLLGRYFSLRDIAAYWIAIALGAFIDCKFLRRGDQGAGVVVSSAQ
jgi:uncharacterized protein DUF2809